MKLSNLILGAAATTVALTAFTTSSQAASVTLTGNDSSSVTVDSNQDYEFSFVRSNGSFQTNFYVPSTTSIGITEASPGYTSLLPDFPGTCAVCSFVSKITLNYFVLETVKANPGDVVPFYDFSTGKQGSSLNIALAVASSSAGSSYVGNASEFLIKLNDRFGDRDFNDFVVKAKAVPVPGIVPGIALAAAFLGSKALKRNKKEAIESVA
ncbi:hypothetical protein HCU40_10195 [Pseudanabaena biceps]|nr:hypothetical protein [Pseudanabaena biceps]